MSRLRVALIQLAADQDVAANVERAVALVRQAGEMSPQLIALPEMFLYRGPAAGFAGVRRRAARPDQPRPSPSWPAPSTRGYFWAAWRNVRPIHSAPTTPPSCSARPARSARPTANASLRRLDSKTPRPIAESARTTPGRSQRRGGDAGRGQDADVRIG